MRTKTERDNFEDTDEAPELRRLEDNAEYRHPIHHPIMVPRDAHAKRATYWVTGTDKSYLEFNSLVIELKVASGMSTQGIADMFGCSLTTIVRCLKKYNPKEGEYDITMTIMSRV